MYVLLSKISSENTGDFSWCFFRLSLIPIQHNSFETQSDSLTKIRRKINDLFGDIVNGNYKPF